MKRFILSLILFSLCLAGIANEPVEVMVLMKALYDRTELCRRAEFYQTKAARRDYVVRELKAFAEASQHDLMVTLKDLEQQGLVSNIHCLWSANAVSFTATDEVIQMLADRDDIESVTPVEKHQCIPEAETTDEVTDISRYTIAPNISQVNALQVWAQGNEGQGVLVAGIVALMLHENPELTPAAICQILEETSLKLTPSKSNRTGAGRVDALAAVTAASEWDGVGEIFHIDDEFQASIQQIFDISGRIVDSDYDKLSPDIYLIQYRQGNQLKTKKILIR